MATILRDRRPSLVIVEDNDIFRYALERTLVSHYAILASVGDGAAGVRAVEDSQPNLVLMDISMPALSGFDAAKRIRERHPAVSIVFITASLEAEHMDQAARLGAAGYLLKSRIAELQNALRAVLGGQRYFSE